MIFLNGLMAIGGLAFALPLAIHLLYRSRYVTLEWGAMHLLANSRLTNTRSIQWHQLLLLLLRCLLPILLALTMSRPLIESWRNVDGRSAMSVAIVLDDSLSMFARQPADTRRDDNVQSVTRFSHACAAAASILDALPSGSDAAVVLAGAKPLTLDSHLPNELSTRLKQLSQRDVPAGNLQIRDALDAAERWLSSSSIAKRLLIIVTDAQEFDWSEMVTSKSLRFSHQAVRHETAFLNIGPSESSSAMNTFIDSISVSPSLIGVGDEVAIHVSLETHGNWVPSSAAHQIATFVDDVEIDRRDIQSANRHSFEVPWSPRTLGCHVIRVESLQEDELLTDNRLSLPVIVRQPVRVLLVNGKENNVSNLGESGFLRLALTPFSGSPQEHRTVFAVKTITLSELDEDVIRGFKTIFLCNVAELTANQQSWLNKYTSAGNGLVVLLGDQVQVDRYRTWPIASQGGIRIV
ncbi:MAG: BatA domain-containing protein, partial [Pirellula sp.]